VSFRNVVALVAVLAWASPTPARGDRAAPRGELQGPGERLAAPEAQVVDGETARELVKKGDVKVVDVRTAVEFEEAHVPGAINIPYDELDRRHGEIGPPTTAVMVYCRKGNRAAIAAETLRALGFSKIYNLQRYSAWRAAEPQPAQ
jgi:phage shock protein E